MKKSFALVLALILIPCAALAEIDLSSLSFADLAALRDQAQLEMMKRDEWQEVTVPQGVYRVGEHIPAGTWTVYCRTGISSLVLWGDTLSNNGHDIESNHKTGRSDWMRVYNPNYKDYKEFYDGSDTSYSFTVRDGEWIVIKGQPVIFTPGAPTPSFSFK